MPGKQGKSTVPWGLCFSRSIYIKAPSESVWDVITDVDDYPNILSSVVCVERDGLNLSADKREHKTRAQTLQIGSTWKESRAYTKKQRKDICSLQVVKLDNRSEPKIFQVSGASYGSMVTATLQVLKETKSTCTLQFSMGVIPNNLMARFKIGYLYRSRFEQLCYAVVEGDLFDYRQAAEQIYTETKLPADDPIKCIKSLAV